MKDRLSEVLWDIRDCLKLEEVSVEGLISIIDDISMFDYYGWNEFRTSDGYYDWLRDWLTK